MDNRREIALPAQIRTAGEIKNVPYHSTPGTKDNDWMLTVLLGEGEGVYRNSQRVLTVTGGMVGLVNGDDRGILLSNPENPYHHFYCRFRGDFAGKLARTILLREGSPFFNHPHTLELADCIRKMGRIQRRDLDDAFGRSEALLLQVLAILNDKESTQSDIPLSWTLVEQYLLRHLSENLTLNRTAKHFNLSRSSFCSMVKRSTGLTFQKNLEKIRMDWACSLLKDTPLNISQVSERIGYSDPLYFSRVFSKNLGMSPREWTQKAGCSGLEAPEIESGTPRRRETT